MNTKHAEDGAESSAALRARKHEHLKITKEHVEDVQSITRSQRAKMHGTEQKSGSVEPILWTMLTVYRRSVEINMVPRPKDTDRCTRIFTVDTADTKYRDILNHVY